MNREVMVAWTYGIVGLVFGTALIWREGPWSRRGFEGEEERTRFSEAPADVARGGESDWELGPEGIRWLDAGPGEEVETSVARAPVASGAPLPASSLGSSGGLPESGHALLAVGDPSIHGVADVLVEAGVTAYGLETGLRDVYGHVQRLAAFRSFANPDPVSASMPASDGASEGPEDVLDPSWRSDLWSRRIVAYAAYMGRDLEARFGIRDDSVVERLMGMADALAAAPRDVSRLGEGGERR